jgi:hypothetical protein
MVVDSVSTSGHGLVVDRSSRSLSVTVPGQEDRLAIVAVSVHGDPTGDALLFARHSDAPMASAMPVLSSSYVLNESNTAPPVG